MDGEEQVDILHPLTSLRWRQCSRLPGAVDDAHMVCLGDKVYVGERGLEGLGSRAVLYIYSPATDTWDTMKTPVYDFALTVYHSQIVLVGGREYGGGSKVWTLGEDGQWQTTLPPMETACLHASAVSRGDHLFVIDRQGVHIYNGHNWVRAQYPIFSPTTKLCITSTIIDGCWYVMRDCETHYTSLDSLLASCQPNDTPQSSSVWKRLPANVPGRLAYLTKFGTRLIAVGTSAIHAFSPTTQSWVRVRSGPFIQQMCPCAVALSSNELMFVEGPLAYRIKMEGPPLVLQHDFCGLM